MCGLFGWCGSEPPNMDKIKILGIYNQSRGHDSCGYYYNNQIKKGVDKLKEFSDFIQSNVLTGADGANIFIGHTRWSTAGLHSEDNQHPFQANNTVLAHNGKIENIWDLCRKYEVDHRNIIVDSKALTYLIDKEGSKILSEYRGYAALLFCNIQNPDSLYIYHGKSVLTENGPEIEERPLYYMVTDKGIYVSSMSEALWAIRDNDESYPEQVEHNRVIKIKNGKFGRSKIIVNRGDCNLNINKTTYYNRTYVNETFNNRNNSYDYGRREYVSAEELEKRRKIREANINAKENISKLIYNETKPKRVDNKAGSIVFFFKGRYYTRIVNDFSELTELANGKFFISNKGFIDTEQSLTSHTYYFFKGVMIKGEKEFNTINNIIREKLLGHADLELTCYNFASAISKYSEYPVCNLESEATSVNHSFKYKWYKNENWNFSINLTPKFSDRVYKLEKGELVSITTSLGNSDTPCLVAVDEKKSLNIENGFVNPKLEVSQLMIPLNTKPSTINNEDVLPKEVVSLVKNFCYRTYGDISEVEAEIPITVLRALELYISEVLVEKDEELSETLIGQKTNEFLYEIVRDNISINDNMSSAYASIEEYVLAAYNEELEQQKKDKKTLDKVLNNLSEIEDAEYVEIDEEISIKMEEEKIEKLISKIEEMRDYAEECFNIESSAMAQSTAASLYKSSDSLIAEVSESLSNDYKGTRKSEFLNRLRKINHNSI